MQFLGGVIGHSTVVTTMNIIIIATPYVLVKGSKTLDITSEGLAEVLKVTLQTRAAENFRSRRRGSSLTV
jgi:hypothetical protein